MGNQRKLERFNLIIPTRLVLAKQEQEDEVYEIKTENICAGGAYFKTKQAIPDGTQVMLSFVLPIEYVGRILGVSSYVTLEGLVVRVEMEGFAVRFKDNYKLMPFRNI